MWGFVDFIEALQAIHSYNDVTFWRGFARGENRYFHLLNSGSSKAAAHKAAFENHMAILLDEASSETPIYRANAQNQLSNGHRVVLLAHSEGSLYANRIYQMIAQDDYQYGTNYASALGLVLVGSPAAEIANQTAGGHVNNSEDLVLDIVRGLGYTVLADNVTYDQPNNILNHDFIKTYLSSTVAPSVKAKYQYAKDRLRGALFGNGQENPGEVYGVNINLDSGAGYVHIGLNAFNVPDKIVVYSLKTAQIFAQQSSYQSHQSVLTFTVNTSNHGSEFQVQIHASPNHGISNFDFYASCICSSDNPRNRGVPAAYTDLPSE